MNSLILNVFNARPEEGKAVYLLLLLGFCVGLFLATYDVAAPAIFLNYYTDDDILAQAFLVSGAIGLLSTFLYSFLQARISYMSLVLFYMVLMLVATSAIWYLSMSENPESWVVFGAFVMAMPFSYISLLIFWGYFGRVFDLKQSKRIIGGIDTGQLIATILALFGIGYVLDNNLINTVDLYIGSMIGVGGMIFSAIIIGLSLKLQSKREGRVRDRTMTLTRLFTNKYTKWMVLFVVVSLICVTFVDYSFLKVTNAQWVTEAEKASFLAKFEATVVLFSFLFQTFVTDWVIANYGLRTSLLINPILSLILIALAIVTGLVMGYVNDQTGDFLWFFLAIAGTKLFIDSLKDALDGPTFKLYFLPIDANKKFDVSTKVEGFVTALGGLLAGGLLILFNTFNLDLIYVVYGSVPILIGWFLITKRMHGGYIGTLQSTLEQTRLAGIRNSTQEAASESRQSEEETLNKLLVLEKTEPGSFEDNALTLVQKSTGKVKDYLQQKIEKLDLSYNPAKSNRELKDLANEAASIADASDTISVSSDRLYNLSKSRNVNDRLLACKLLQSLMNDANIFILLELLRDSDYAVKQQAISTARKVKRSETWPILLELLHNKNFIFEATDALAAGGEEVLPSLENAFHRSGQTQDAMLKIVDIIGKIGGPKAQAMLWDKIDFHDRKIVRQILQLFSKQRAKPTGLEITQLKDLLDLEIGKAIWNLSAQTEISDEPYNDLLHEALKQEIRSNFDFIYMILSLIYDGESVKLVKENIEAGTTDGSAYALELLDIFLDPDLKPKLYPLLDDIEVSEKLEKLQVFFPRETYEEEETYNYLLNREITSVNRWTKACTLYAISHHDSFEINDSIVAHMFNSDALISELATAITFKHKPGQFRVVERRMRATDPALHRVISNVKNGVPTVFDITLMLMRMPYFEGFNGQLMSQLVGKMDMLKLTKGYESSLLKDQDIYILVGGAIELTNPARNQSAEIHSGDIFGVTFFDNLNQGWRMNILQNSFALRFNINDMFNILTNRKDLAQELLKQIRYHQTEKIFQ